jgi:hypothetical protein
MSAQDLASLVSAARNGSQETISALIAAVARDLRAFIATFAATREMIEEAHTSTWIQVRKELPSCPVSGQAIIWIRQRAISSLRQLLDGECAAAITARDGLRHLVIQDGIEGIQALVSPNNEGAAQLNQRYATLDEDLQLLLSRRYSDGATLAELAAERGWREPDIAIRLFTARAGLHWRATDADRRAPDDRLLPPMIEQLLGGTLTAEARQTLGTSLMKDLGRASAFVRQVRIDLMLSAVFGPYGEQEARALAGTLAKIEHKRRNESSLLQVVAPPRTPVGTGSELQRANDRIANRQTGTQSSSVETAGARPAHRGVTAGGRRRQGSSDQRDGEGRARPRGNQHLPMIIAGAVVAVGLLSLLLVWGGGGSSPTPAGTPKSHGPVATLLGAQGPVQLIDGAKRRPVTVGSVLQAGQGLESGRSEATVELGNTRLVLEPATLVETLDLLPDRSGQARLAKGSLRVQVLSTPGFEVRTAHARVTFAATRGNVTAEADRTLVQAQGGGVVVSAADGSGVTPVPPDGRVEIAAGSPPRLLKAKAFVRGINLGGNAVTIDRQRWLSHRQALSAGLSLAPGTDLAPPAAFSGAGLDFDRKTMLDTGLTGSGTVQFAQKVPDGDYDLTLWLANTAGVTESQLTVTVNGDRATLGQVHKRDTWLQLGPLPVRASKGLLDIRLEGHANARAAGLALEAPGGSDLLLPAAVAMVSPVDSASFYRGETITLRAEVIGTASKVQFYDGERLLGESGKEPFSLVVKDLEPGEHRIIARMVNPKGDPSVSLPLAISVMTALGSGGILVERWNDLPGDKLANAPEVSMRAPSTSEVRKDFSARTDWGDEIYVRMRGWIHAPITGEYVFWVASDDEGELLLSTDDSPANLRRIAHCVDAAASREWTKHASQQSQPIPLIAGNRYYVEVRYKEHHGGDLGMAGWKLPNGVVERPIPGAHLSPAKP